MPAFAQFVRFISLLSLPILSNMGVAQEIKILLKNESTKTLTLYNWSEYCDEKPTASFKAKYNVDIHQVFYETEELKNEYLISTNGGEDLDKTPLVSIDRQSKNTQFKKQRYPLA